MQENKIVEALKNLSEIEKLAKSSDLIDFVNEAEQKIIEIKKLELDTINQTAIIDYIMAQYDENSGLFMDKYAYRYLDTDFSQTYYPYTSVLEVNCYAILSLAVLDRLDLINSQDFVNFVWSCYNPSGSGFIRPAFVFNN